MARIKKGMKLREAAIVSSVIVTRDAQMLWKANVA